LLEKDKIMENLKTKTPKIFRVSPKPKKTAYLYAFKKKKKKNTC